MTVKRLISYKSELFTQEEIVQINKELNNIVNVPDNYSLSVLVFEK